MYDAIVVGSRCAGAPLGLQLARAGHRVLMVDRAKFPSDTMSTHFIQAPGMARLARWGVLDDVMATGCPPVTKVRFSTSPGEYMNIDVPQHSLPGLVGPRRTLLDKILVDAAVDAGAELAEGVSIDSLQRDGDRVTGVVGHTSAGEFRAEARFVVGADGRNSVVAREVDAPIVEQRKETSSGYYTYYRNLPVDGVETCLHDGLFLVVLPTNDDLTLVGIGWRPERFKDIKRDVENEFLAALDKMGDIGPRTRAAERAERFVGAHALPNYLRKAHGPGWALVGDALCHKDPAPADGISDAFRASEYLAEAIDDTLTTGDETAAMERFERRHAEIAVPLLDAAVRVADFDRTPQERFEAFIEIRMRDGEEADQVLAPATNGA